MADGRGVLRHELRLARGTIDEIEEDRFWLKRHLRYQDRYMRELQQDNDGLREAAHRRERELQTEADKQKADLQRYVQDKETTGRRIQELEAKVDEQKANLQRYVQDKETADKRIYELEASRNNANPAPVPRDPPPATDNARPSKRRRQESPVADQRVSWVERERVDRPLAPKDSRREVPGLSLVLVQDENITERVVEKLTSVMEKPIGKKNMELFLEHRRSRYYCIHEVVSKGRYVSNPLTPSQPCRGCASTIRVRCVRTESGSFKLQVGHFTMEV